MRRARHVAVVVAAVLALALAGCSDDGDPGDPPAPDAAEPSRPAYDQYVAIGDSYTAAPLVPTTDPGDPCLRSDRNYPHLVARRLLVIDLTDVSCSGADTRSIRRGGTIFGREVPSQLVAVRPETDLVTLSVGGNVGDLFGTLIVECTEAARARPQRSCADDLGAGGGDVLLDLLPRITRDVQALVDDVRSRAPDARVVVVTYPQIVPERGTCPELPLTARDYRYARTVNEGLARAVADGAEAAGVEWVDVFAATDGHDICARDPWVNGAETDPQRALAYHPFGEEQRAVADELVELLGD